MIDPGTAPQGTQSSDQTFYDSETHYLDDPTFLSGHLAMLESYISSYRPKLADLAAKGRKLRTLELGAGTCTLSLMLSREPWIGSMHCVDISIKRMQALANDFARQIGGRIDLLKFSGADFSNPLPFEDGSFDVVLFDAALHHSRNMWLTLRECHRLLAPNGLLIAQREQYVAIGTYRYALSRLLRSQEVRSGVAENAYLKGQYEFYLRATGFRPAFTPVSPGWWRWVWFLNGLIFSKWTIVAERRSQAPVFD